MRRLPTEFNDQDPSVHLLSHTEFADCRYYVATLKKDIEDWRFSHNMWSKYHDNFWFQRATGFTEDYMLQQFYRYAKLLTSFEPELVYWERIIYLHMVAIEALNKDMTFLKKIDLTKTELKQQALF